MFFKDQLILKKGLPLLCLFLLLTVKGMTQNEPTVATCDGDQSICLTENSYDLCVEINVESSFPFMIDSFLIDFDDGSAFLWIAGNDNPPNQSHQYDFSDIYNQNICFEEKTVRLYTYYTENGNVVTVSTATFVKFFNPANARFNLPGIACVDTEIVFSNNSFPNNNNSHPQCGLVSTWNYGDGTSGTDPFHQYSTPGNYDITLTVEGFCGSDMVTHSIEIVEPATATAIPEPGFINLSGNIYQLCLDSLFTPVSIPLNGDSLSIGETSFIWSALNIYPGATYETNPPSNDPTPNISDPFIVFSDTGFYQVILTVNNPCLFPSYDTLLFQISSGNSLGALNQPDVCDSLSYTPENFRPDATYTINGNPVTTFPITLYMDSYIVVCTLPSDCGEQVVTDNFEVSLPIDVVINPLVDDTLCVGSEPVLLTSSPQGGTWSGSANIIQIGDSVWYDPMTRENISLTYTGPGGCPDSESINIDVIGVDVIANDYLKCNVSDPFLLEATPSGGIWSATDCSGCIVNDSFYVSTMIGLNLTTVNLMYQFNSPEACEGMTTINVTIRNPSASFILSDSICLGDTPTVDLSNVAGDILVWQIDGLNSSIAALDELTEGNHEVTLAATIGACEETFSSTITVAAPPELIAFSTTPIDGCADLEVAITNNSLGENLAFEWYLDTELISTSPNPANIILGQGLSDTTYNLSLVVANGCGGSNVSQVIIVRPKPIARFGTNKNEYCSGDTIYFTDVSLGNPENIEWDFGNGITSIDSLPPYLIFFTDSIPREYPITLIAFNNCGTDTLIRNIIVNPTDVDAFFNTDPTSGCVGVPVCFESFSTVGANVLFDFGDGNTTTSSIPCHTYESAGTYQVSLKAFGCGFDSITTTIVIHPAPTIDALNTQLACPNETIMFNPSTINAVDFYWEFGDGNTTTTNIAVHSYANPGIYQVKLTATSIEGCNYTDSTEVTIVELPAADFSVVNDSLCVGSAVNFNNTSSSIANCFWDFGDGNTSTSCSPSHTFGQNNNFTVTLIITNNNGCKDTLSRLVNIFSEPNPSFTAIGDQTCTPVAISFLNESTSAESYFWEFDNGQTSTNNNPEIIFDQGGIFDVSLTATNGWCSRTTTLPVTIYQTPEPIVALSSNEVCFPDSINFGTVAIGENLDYHWTLGDGTTSFDTSFNHYYAEAGTYPIQLVVSSAFCQDSSSTEVIIFEPVEIIENITDVLCFGEATGAIDIDIVNGTAPYQIDWSNNGVGMDQNNIVADDYELIIIDQNNCMLMDTLTIVQPDSAIGLEVLSETIVTCFGGSDGGISVLANGGTPGYTYLWETGDTAPSIENFSAGDYLLTITDDQNCVSVNTIELHQNDPIIFEATVENSTCNGYDDGQIIIENITGGVGDYTVFAPQIDSINRTLFSNLSPATYSIIVVDRLGCSGTFTGGTTEPAPIWINIRNPEDSLMILLGTPVDLETVYNIPTASFSWTPDRWLDCIDCDSPVALPTESTPYRVTMTDEAGCFAQDSIWIDVNKERTIAIPNTFTPNFDGHNDVFTLLGNNPAVVRVAVFQVFDRWGGKLFEAKDFQLNDPDYGWDGTAKGKQIEAGTYVYFAQIEYVDNKILEQKGSILLIR